MPLVSKMMELYIFEIQLQASLLYRKFVHSRAISSDNKSARALKFVRLFKSITQETGQRITIQHTRKKEVRQDLTPLILCGGDDET